MTATPLVVRDDLSRRNVLSKSALTEFDMCQASAWHSIHHRLPIIPNERMTFGSAVDAAVEQIVVMLRSGNPVELNRVMAAVDEVIAREDTGVDRDEVERAAEMFVPQVAVNYDWAFCRTQPSIDITLPDLGDINTHPDLVLRGNVVRDVKTGKQAKPDEPTLELGFYGLCVEAETNEPVPTVGYFTWVRVARPYWQVREFAFTDELRRWTRERAGGYVRAKKADEVLNRKTPEPRNYSFPGGPKFPSLCDDCQYNPANGGPCVMARQAEEIA
jgi:CRISPR/Cas system-associated exonuclease Cas4 (RecB family)